MVALSTVFGVAEYIARGAEQSATMVDATAATCREVLGLGGLKVAGFTADISVVHVAGFQGRWVAQDGVLTAAPEMGRSESDTRASAKIIDGTLKPRMQ